MWQCCCCCQCHIIQHYCTLLLLETPVGIVAHCCSSHFSQNYCTLLFITLQSALLHIAVDHTSVSTPDSFGSCDIGPCLSWSALQLQLPRKSLPALLRRAGEKLPPRLQLRLSQQGPVSLHKALPSCSLRWCMSRPLLTPAKQFRGHSLS